MFAGPWQGQCRGEIKDLPIHYLIDLEDPINVGRKPTRSASNSTDPGEM